MLWGFRDKGDNWDTDKERPRLRREGNEKNLVCSSKIFNSMFRDNSVTHQDIEDTNNYGSLK